MQIRPSQLRRAKLYDSSKFGENPILFYYLFVEIRLSIYIISTASYSYDMH